MKIKMAVSPREPEAAERRYWAVEIIRVFAILQVIGATVLGFTFLGVPVKLFLVGSMHISDDVSVWLAAVVSMGLGLLAGLVSTAFLFALAKFFEDVHAIRGYLRDVYITGQYYDD